MIYTYMGFTSHIYDTCDITLILTTTSYLEAKKTKVSKLKWPFLMLNGYQKQKMITNYSQENFKNIYWWLSKIKYNKFGCILMQYFYLCNLGS
jgi:hypothetical protein